MCLGRKLDIYNPSLIIVKSNEPYSFTKGTLREDVCSMLIKSTTQAYLSNLKHFNTPPHV
jgi:hypothetical protein